MGLPDVPPGIETQANARFDQFVSAIGSLQTGYLAANGRYFQGILTGLPADGSPSAPDKSKRPTDQAEDWAAFGITLPNNDGPSVIGYGLDVYPAGFVAFGEIEIAGKTWRRQTDFGPDGKTYTWRDIYAGNGWS